MNGSNVERARTRVYVKYRMILEPKHWLIHSSSYISYTMLVYVSARAIVG